MGLFRLAVVAAVAVSLLPSDSEQQEMLYNRAANAAHWTLTFCERNAATCTQAAGLWSEFRKKAEFGAHLAYDMMMEQAGNSVASAAEQPGAAGPASLKTQSGTLKPEDLSPGWRGTGTPSAQGHISVRSKGI